jgi:polyphosphate kinase 2 (PPK2 family)
VNDLPSLWTHEPHTILRFRAGDRVADIDADSSPGFTGDKNDAPKILAERSGRFADLQEMLYANGKEGDHRSVLLVLQGMDTAGKGGIVTHVVGAGNPMGIRYTSFGKPTAEERAHHFLWRINKALPAAGQIGVFDRSHYEDVLVVRVHGLAPPGEVEGRYAEINTFESELIESGVKIVKVALFVSPDEQKRWTDPTNSGSTTRAISMSENSGRPTRRPINWCWTGLPPTTHRGTWCRATRSGTADWP